jgi:HK97 family phage portal protein
VYKCVRAYADSIGTMPRRLMRQVDERTRRRERGHPVAQLLSVRPNRWQTPAMFVGMLEAHAQLRGRGYAEIFNNPRTYEPEELVPIHPDRVTTEVMMDGTPRWQVRPPRGQVGAARTLLPGEMFHVTTMTMDGYEGVSPIDAEREAIGAAIAARDYGARFWANDAKPPFWIKVPGKFKDDDDKSSFRDKWQVSYGGQNRNRPAVLDRGMELVALGVTNEQAQYIQARNATDIDICGIFRVPPHKVGILSEAKWANIEMQNIEWVTDSLLARIVMWEEACQRDLLGYDEELYVKFVPDQLLRGDIKARYEAYGKGITDGHLTRNEARELEDRDPLPGLDEPLQPLNMTRVGSVLPTPGRDRNERAQAIFQAAAERVARAEAALVQKVAQGKCTAAEAFAEHARFVGQCLALPQDVAAGYADAVRVQVEQLHAADGLSSITADHWVATQSAALARLGD